MSTSSSTALPSLTLRCRIPGSKESQPLTVDADAPLAVLVHTVATLANIPANRVKLLCGFPPKPIPLDESSDVLPVSTFLRHNETLIVQSGDAQAKQGSTDGRYVPPASERTVFVRRPMPGDNSCLFHAAAYVLENKREGYASAMRAKCAECVAANPKFFTAALLGTQPADYVQWILHPSSWGGQIELVVLSFLYQTEIIALDLSSQRMERVGESHHYTTRVFLVFTGNHYDAVAMTPAMGGSAAADQVIFSATDDRVFERAKSFVREESGKKR